MKIKIWFFLAGSIFLFQSCATTPTTTISAVAARDQKTGHGETIVSQKKHFVSFAPYTKLESAVSNVGLAENKTKFLLTVENCGSDFIEFNHKNISVFFVPDAYGTEPVSVGIQSWQDFVDEMDKGYDAEEKQYLYNTLYEIYMQSEVGLDVTEELDDLVIDLEDMRDQNDVLQEMLPAIIIKDQRIQPGKSYTGLLICDTRNLDADLAGDFRIRVVIDGEEHRFVFKRGLPE